MFKNKKLYNELETIPVEEIFKLCTWKGKYYFHEQTEIENRALNYENLLAEIKDTDLFPFFEFLIPYQNKWLAFIEDDTLKVIIKSLLSERDLSEKYTILLQFLFRSIEKKDDIYINIVNSKGEQFKISDFDITKALYESIVRIYCDKELNTSRLTRDEAINSLVNPINYEDLKLFCNLCNYDIKDINLENLPDDIVTKFASSIVRKREVNYDFLKSKIEELSNAKILKKKGAKNINRYLGELALDLSYLIRFYRFILQDECDNIYNYKITNEDCRIILKYFRFWGLLRHEDLHSDYVYISSMINQHKKKRGDFDLEKNCEFNEIEIDKTRKDLRKEFI